MIIGLSRRRLERSGSTGPTALASRNRIFETPNVPDATDQTRKIDLFKMILIPKAELFNLNNAITSVKQIRIFS